MRVSLDLPKSKRDPLLTSLDRSFHSSQKQLMGLAKSLDALEEMGKRHDKLLSSLEDLMELKRKLKKKGETGTPDMERLMDRLESAILKSSTRSRSRTFGSNF